MCANESRRRHRHGNATHSSPRVAAHAPDLYDFTCLHLATKGTSSPPLPLADAPCCNSNRTPPPRGPLRYAPLRVRSRRPHHGSCPYALAMRESETAPSRRPPTRMRMPQPNATHAPSPTDRALSPPNALLLTTHSPIACTHRCRLSIILQAPIRRPLRRLRVIGFASLGRKG